jgi:chaperonin GroES
MHIRMRNGNVAIQLMNEQSVTPGGIVIPQSVKRGILQYGKVFSVGPGELIQGKFIEMDLKKDDEVIFDSSHSEPVQIDRNTIYICNMFDVIATVSAKHLSVVPADA